MTSSFSRDLVAIVPDLRAYARALTRDRDAADDLVQDTMVRALRAQHQYTPETNLKAWAFTILRNQHISNVRRQRFQAAPLDDLTPALCAIAPRQDAALDLEDFERAFATLPAIHREILLLIGASGVSYEEAAGICGCAMGTIKSRLSRARRELLAALNGNDLPRRAANHRRSAPTAAARVQSRAKALPVRAARPIGQATA